MSHSPEDSPNLRREVRGDHVCVLTFDRPGSSANIFDRATLQELDTHLAFIEANPGLRGVVLQSAKPAIFIAGADLHTLASAPPEALREIILAGQRIFNRLAALPVPTVAAIHGACVGGGFEVALACRFRLASSDKATKIGLPETQLGIIPGWGGSTRLPRLIGLPQALDIILAGKTVAAAVAFKRGLVDGLAPRENLLEAALALILRPGAEPHAHTLRGAALLALLNNPISSALIAARVRPGVLKRTRGHYPAVPKALEVVTRGISRSLTHSLGLEADAVTELAATDSTQNLIRVFFMQEHARKLAATEEPAPPKIRSTAVIGAGVMGAGIAQWLAARGLPVVLRDINAAAIARGMATIQKLFEAGVKRRVFTPVEARAALDRISPSADPVPLLRVDLVIEAAVERIDLKQAIFRELESLAGPDTLLATNTSALSLTELAAGLKSPGRVVGIHFFNPVHRMQLVEVIHTAATDPVAVRRAIRFVQQMGKLPVLVRDSPGFVVNRILMPYLIEAGRLFESGASVTAIDEAMLEFGMPMGPLRLIDEVGVDVARHVSDTLVGHYRDRLIIPEVLPKLLQAGWLGRKTGRGFYNHAGRASVPNPDTAAFRQDRSAAGLSRSDLQARLMLLMVNEAARCVEEGIVKGPEQVDFAMIMGTGFAPFRGGPLRHADATRPQQIVRDLTQLAAQVGPRYTPCARLTELAAERGRFYPESQPHP